MSPTDPGFDQAPDTTAQTGVACLAGEIQGAHGSKPAGLDVDDVGGTASDYGVDVIDRHRRLVEGNRS